MEAFVAALIVGFAMALAANFTTMWLLYALIGEGKTGWIEGGSWSTMIGATVVGAGTFGWMAISLVAAIVYALLDGGDGPSGLGSSNLPFTAIMVALAWLPVPALYYLFPRYWWYYGSLALIFAALHGWAFPLVAERS